MSKSRLLAGVALAALCIPVAALSPSMPLGASAAQAQSANVSFQLFFDQLEPHGVWVRHAKYSYVFCPTGIDSSWRPYTHGRWLYIKDRGWYFASNEPFAWATYHYGRWFADQKLGWCWVPGTKWAPAWVSWRRSDAVVGWAPLPPEGEGYAVSVEVSRRELPEPYWVFVPTESFVEPDLSVNIVIGSQQPDYYVQTQFLGPVTVEGDVVINNVIDVTYIEQTINQQVTVYQAQAAADPAAQTVDVDAKAIAIFDQDVAEPAAKAAPPEPVEEADAAATIETEGGTAGATVDLPDETGAATAAPAPDANAQPAEPAANPPPAPAGEQPTAEQPSEQKPASSDDTAAPSDSGAQQAPAPEAPADTKAPPAAEQPAAEGSSGQPVEGKPDVCAPDATVDGKCPPAGDRPAAAPDAEAPTPEQTEPAPEAASPPADATAPAAAPAPEPAKPAEPEHETPPASDAGTAPANEPAAQGDAARKATTPDGAAPCPPESMVDGKCPAVPAEPAQQ